MSIPIVDTNSKKVNHCFFQFLFEATMKMNEYYGLNLANYHFPTQSLMI